MFLKKPTIIAFVLSVSVIATGCASKSDKLAGRIADRGSASSDIASRYAKAQKMISQGESKVKQGDKLVRRGENAKDAGEKLINRGEEMRLLAKSEYCQQVNFQDPDCS